MTDHRTSEQVAADAELLKVKQQGDRSSRAFNFAIVLALAVGLFQAIRK
jgi:hypothetical protein